MRALKEKERERQRAEAKTGSNLLQDGCSAAVCDGLAACCRFPSVVAYYCIVAVGLQGRTVTESQERLGCFDFYFQLSLSP